MWSRFCKLGGRYAKKQDAESCVSLDEEWSDLLTLLEYIETALM